MNVFDLAAKLTIDSSEYDKGLGDARNAAESFGSKLKSSLSVAGAAAGAAVTAAGAAVTKVVKDAVASYGDYEQLAGGIETLFGDSADKMKAFASQASSAAGLSMNEYMDTAIQSGAALISSLEGDVEKASDLMNMSVIDMADNVNKMGTSMESVQNAYRGFSRGNFTMLDNLALGFAGTKEGMQELLEQAREISGIEYDIGSYGDIVQAIHVVQEEMGIAGTTAKEASSTIQGSFKALKSTLQNLVTSLGSPNADLGVYFDELILNAETAFENLMPVVEQALTGISEVIGHMGPVIAEKLPGILAAVLPTLLSTATTLVVSFGEAIIQVLPTLVPIAVDALMTLTDAFIANLPMLLSVAVQLITTLADGIAQSLPELIPTIVDVVLQMVDILTDPDTLSSLVDASIAIMIALAEGLIEALPKLIEKAPEIISNLVEAIVENLPKIFQAGVDILFQIVNAIKDNLGEVWDAAIEIVTNILDGIKSLFTKLWQVGKDTISKIWDGLTSEDTWKWGKDIAEKIINGIKDMLQKIWDTGKEIITKLWNGFLELKPVQWAIDLINDFISGIKQDIGSIWSIGSELINNVWEGIKSLDPLQWGKDLIGSFVDGIKQGWNWLSNGVSEVAQGVKNFIGFSEPKEGPLSNFHTFAPDMMKLFAQGITDNQYLVDDALARAFNFEPKIRAGFDANGYAIGQQDTLPQTIVVQSVLDGRVIGETAYNYSRERKRMVGA